MNDNHTTPVELNSDQKTSIVNRKATCPFIASAVAQGSLAVRNSAQNPLASIEDLRVLGNTGGGNLGDVLVLFANGNHALMQGMSGKLDAPVPSGLFSLDFPASQGSHPGHSGILQGDPEVLDSGRLSEADFQRLISREQNGLIKRSDVGRFIAENVLRDSKSKVLGKNAAWLLLSDSIMLLKAGGSTLVSKLFSADDKNTPRLRNLKQKLTRLLGEENLAGSAGEFGLLFALLANKPGAQKVDGEPTLEVRDLRAMFIEKRLPEGWETWRKSRKDWIRNTFQLMSAARKEHRRLKRTKYHVQYDRNLSRTS